MLAIIRRAARRCKSILVQKLDGLLLPLFRNRSEDHAVLPNVLLLRVETTDDRGHVIHFERPLAQHPSVQFSQIVIRFSGLGRGGRQQQLGPIRLADDQVGGATVRRLTILALVTAAPLLALSREYGFGS